MDYDGWAQVKNFSISLLSRLTIGPQATQVAVIVFSRSSWVWFRLGRYPSAGELETAITAIPFMGGSTDLNGALYLLWSDVLAPGNGARSDALRAAVVITDGEDTENRDQTLGNAARCRDLGVQLMAVGITDQINEDRLLQIVSYPGDFYTVSEFSQLSSILVSLSSRLDCPLFQTMPTSTTSASTTTTRTTTTTPTTTTSSSSSSSSSSTTTPTTTTTTVAVPTLKDVIESSSTTSHMPTTSTRPRTGGKVCSVATDLVFVVCTANQIRTERMVFITNLLTSIVQQFNIGPDATRVGALRYSDTANVSFHLNQYQTSDDVISALRRISFTGGPTRVADAIRLMSDVMFSAAAGDREDAVNVAVILWDGANYVDSQQAIDNAIAARQRNIHIIAFGVGSDVSQFGLTTIASQPTEANVFVANSMYNLASLRDPIVTAACDDYDACRGVYCGNGGTCDGSFSVSRCICPDGFIGPNCSMSCAVELDVVFILDLSGSMDEAYGMVVQLARQVVHEFNVRPEGSVNIAVITFSDTASVEFQLTSYNTNALIYEALYFRRPAGTTNTQAALRLSYESVFMSSRGDRPTVDNIAIVVTDGQSNVAADRTVPEAQAARQRGVRLFAVAVGQEANMDEIDGIADTPSDRHVVRMRTDGEVETAAAQLIKLLCTYS